ncbi:MAG: NUDIX hydrolase [Chloroflexi bacterium]|nr:NUDIX hydrolase [Chloroflexota bacterium]MBV9600017.1 NUDIX hydrolase [Chloroflexota bacterium]
MARGGRRFKRGRGRRDGTRGADAGPSPNSSVAGSASVSSAASRPPQSSNTNQARGGGSLVRDVSAGGVVYRRTRDDGPIEVVLVGRIRPKRWALPKGTPVLGETLEGTAVREVGEETGLLVRIERPLDQIHYWFVWGGVRHSKTVHFYLMQMTGGDTANHDGEYDVVEWFPIGEALRRLSYPNEARIVDKAQQVLSA